MKHNKLSKKIMSIYIGKHKSPKIKRKATEAEKDTNNYLTTKFELINKILNLQLLKKKKKTKMKKMEKKKKTKKIEI